MQYQADSDGFERILGTSHGHWAGTLMNDDIYFLQKYIMETVVKLHTRWNVVLTGICLIYTTDWTLCLSDYCLSICTKHLLAGKQAWAAKDVEPDTMLTLRYVTQ